MGLLFLIGLTIIEIKKSIYYKWTLEIKIRLISHIELLLLIHHERFRDILRSCLYLFRT